MRLSNLRVGDIGKFVDNGREFLVTSRYPDDRVCGSTEVYYLDGAWDDFIWDKTDPEVVKTGTGRIETRIVKNGI